MRIVNGKEYAEIVSFSGGKDSTAMLLMLLEKGYDIDEVIFADTGKEFDEIIENIEKMKKIIPVTILNGDVSFEDSLARYGWARMTFRHCTTVLKKSPFSKYLKKYKRSIEYVGIAYDEPKRIREQTSPKTKRRKEYPLFEWGVTEQDALEYCYSKGFYFSGIYKKIKRASCFCCPFSNLKELKVLYNDFPDKWKELKELEKISKDRFRLDYTFEELEYKFEQENKQTTVEEICK